MPDGMGSRMTAAFFEDGPNDPDPLLEDLKGMLRQHAGSFARNNQKAMGPSEIGHPCGRNIVGRMLGFEAINPQFDPLPAYLGTAAHKQMEDAAALDNERIAKSYADPTTVRPGPMKRWLTETKVHVRDGLSGTCDLYDTWTGTVIDYKFPGTSRMTMYRKAVAAGLPPSTIYKRQCHFYGRGYQRAGYPVKRVAIWLIPRAGMLSTSVLWSEDYDDGLVDAEFERVDSLLLLADELDIDHHPERLQWVPKTPYDCNFCPMFTVRKDHPSPAACRGEES